MNLTRFQAISGLTGLNDFPVFVRHHMVCPADLLRDLVGELCSMRTGVKGIKGDGDPIDICVLTEKTMAHGISL